MIQVTVSWHGGNGNDPSYVINSCVDVSNERSSRPFSWNVSPANEV